MHDKVNLVLGTMTFGEQVFGDDTKKMIDCFLSSGFNELDTAYVYNNGECEKLLGEALKTIKRENYKIATKANPRITDKLDKSAVISQLNESLTRLNLEYVDVLYLHFPDPKTPIEEALEGCAKLYSEGKFKELGLSNFPAWLVSETYNFCKNNGWMMPKIYEGLYNPLSRHAERELDKALTYYDMRFYAYNPLAGGMLTDRYSGKEHKITEGRFTNRPGYQDRYWKDSYFDAVDCVKKECEKFGINIVEATYRWLLHHSMLNANRGDAVIVGASQISQLEQNLSSASKGELPKEIVSVFDEAWKISKIDAPEYFKFYVPKKQSDGGKK